MSRLYHFTLKDINGNDFSFRQLEGKITLIVNTASKCGFTPQYEGLQQLYEKYKNENFIILGFPSNDFLFQEPGNHEEIKNFCLVHYGVDFPLFEKIHVRGRNQHELYQYLTEGQGNKEYKGSVKWNFTKFLFNHRGQLVGRYSPMTKPHEIEKDILRYLEILKKGA